MSISIPPKYRLRVKQRLHVVAYAQAHCMKPAGRHFGLDRKTVRIGCSAGKLVAMPGWHLGIPNDDSDACHLRRLS